MAAYASARVTRARRAERLHGVYVIVNEDGRALDLTRAVLDAGVRIVQYRAKRGIIPEHLRGLREMTRECDALLVVNDDWWAAEQFDCDGVHLGPDDTGFDRVADVRKTLGQRLVGLSCGTVEEARAARDADYIGVGSIYATASKDDAGAPIGIDGLREIADVTPLPVAAIGGISAATLANVRAAGAAMAAVISAISEAPDPCAAARELVAEWRR